MRRAIATVSMSGTLREKLEAAAAARFDAVELCDADFVAFRGTARELRRIADDLGIAIDLYQPALDFEGVAPPLFSRTLERAERKLDVLESLGTPALGVTANACVTAMDDRALAVQQLHTLAERAARRNLRIAFEASPAARWARNYQQAWALLQEVAHPHIGLRLDSFQVLLTPEADLSDIPPIPGNRIFFVEIADGRRARGDSAQSSWFRAFPGQGDLDVARFLETVVMTGYGGTICLKSVSDVFRAIPNRRTATDGMRSLLFLESGLRQRLEDAAAGGGAPAVPARVLSTVPLFDPPDATPLGGFAFLEFGADADTAVRLEAALFKMGFARFGRHRSKDVTLYRQGEIQVLVNADVASDARKRFDARGACVCCLGLVAENPARAAGRATAFLSARRDSRRGEQELDIPTLVAPAGTLIQFVPPPFQIVEADFVADPGARAGTPCGVKTVDHVAMGLTVEQLDTWVLFTSSVLGLAPAELVDIAEPFGVIRSRGVANDSRLLRILLNAAVTRSQVGPGATPGPTTPSGDVDYIALGCDDIFDTVERLRANGVTFVSLSSNYYDDLITRVSLDRAVLERMRALDIVYDNTGGGDYFQAYTHAFEGRFHFQIVQRQRYDGYGARNASAHAASVEQLRQVSDWFQSVL
jgi:4-hydroxyphenylpyruvate dioxygenase